MENFAEVGVVKNVREYLAYLDGLPTAKVNDIVMNEQGLRGWVSALYPDKVELLLLDPGEVEPGSMFHHQGQRLSVPVGPFLLGRAVNPLGVPIDGKGLLAKTGGSDNREIDKVAGGIAVREFIKKQFDTGITLVDTLIPLARGQRELVLGDARSGKTDFLIDVIVNQKNSGVICVYTTIGKPIATVRTIVDTLRANNALPYTVVVATSSTDTSPLIFLTPQTAFTIAEYFQSLGKDVLLILDDMGSHAKIYREIALLSDKTPGRESYPGDIFYQHAHLLERAGNFNKQAGGGSITALPSIELNLNDFTAFIPTNLMSMTDGHLLFKSSLYNQAQRPAIDISLSVSRVGQQTQERIQNLLSTRIKQVLGQAEQLESISRFSSELPFSTQILLHQKDLIYEVLKQPSLTYIPKEVQTILIALTFTSFFLKKGREFVTKSIPGLIQAFLRDPELMKVTAAVFKLKNEDELIQILEKLSLRLDAMMAVAQSSREPKNA